MAVSGPAEADLRERPIARTVYALAARRFTGRVRAGTKERAVALGWDRGRVVAAETPFSADSVGKVAVAAKLATPEQVQQALKAKGSAGELAALGEVAELGERQLRALAGRTLAQRASRLFALDEGRIVVEEGSAPRAARGAPPIDPRWLIARGVLAHYSETRLARELAPLREKAIRLAEDAGSNLEAFQLPAGDESLLAALRQGPRSLEEIIAAAGLERRRARALVCVFLATDCLELEAPRRAAPAQAASPPLPQGRSGDETASSSPATNERAAATLELIGAKLEAIEEGADAFALLGLDRGASEKEVRKAYFELAKKLHPDRLQALGLAGRSEGQRVFAELNRAFGILGDSKARAAYEKKLERGGERDATDKTTQIVAAEDHVRRGEAALRQAHFERASHEFEKAVEINPDEGEHHALAAWAQWSTASDKDAVLARVVERLDKALELAPKSAAAHYYRGQIAKQSGQQEEAAARFRKTLELKPDHREAALELRLLEKRRAKRTSGGGLFNKLKRS